MNSHHRLIVLNMLLILVFSCGRSEIKIQMARSLDEAKTLAAETGSFIVIDFWRHG